MSKGKENRGARGGASSSGNARGASAGGESHRQARVERELREVIGTYLIRGFRGELPGFITVTRIIVSGDLRQAKVLVTAMPTGENEELKGRDPKAFYKATADALQAQAYDVQEEVNRQLKMKNCPRLTFIYDDGFDNAMKVENVLRQLKNQRVGEGSGEGAGEGHVKSDDQAVGGDDHGDQDGDQDGDEE
jgi:ribosome-binding factor A